MKMNWVFQNRGGRVWKKKNSRLFLLSNEKTNIPVFLLLMMCQII